MDFVVTAKKQVYHFILLGW